MRKPILIIALLCGLGVTGFSQKKPAVLIEVPRLGGTWEYEGTKPRDLRSRTLVISQSGDELAFSERLEYEKEVRTIEFKVYPDKRGESNVLTFPNSNTSLNVRSVTSWKKGKLVRRLTYSSPAQAGANQFEVRHVETETYSLSKDGMVLTVEIATSRESPFSSMPVIAGGRRKYQRRS